MHARATTIACSATTTPFRRSRLSSLPASSSLRSARASRPPKQPARPRPSSSNNHGRVLIGYMHKPPRRMHTSTGRFPFSRRSPSKRRAFLGVFNITKSIGRHDKGQRPRISLQITRCRPIAPPIIREKHRRARIFARMSVCRGLRLQNTRKNARRHHPHMTRSKTKARPKRPRTIFIQIYIARR